MGVYAIVLLLLSELTSSNPAEFHIAGYIRNMPNQKLALDFYVEGRKIKQTTSSVDGKFSFVGAVPEPVFANIHEEFGEGEIELFLENGEWTITGDYSTFNDSEVAGSASDRAWKEYFKYDQQLIKDFEKNKDDEVVKIDVPVVRDLKEARTKLLKSYVQKLSHDYAGALIPNFCTIERSLTRQDWQEIYDILSPDIRSTWYGKKIKARIDGDTQRLK